MYIRSVSTRALQKATEIFRQQGGLLRTMQAIDLGIHPRTLYEMRDKVMIHQLTRGLYRLATLPPTPELDLVAIAARIPRATVCLASALAYHRIVTTSPQAVQIALPRGTKAPTLEPPVHVFRFSGKALTEGVQVVRFGAVTLRVYRAEKAVADCFRFRNKIGIDVAIEALYRGLDRKQIKLSELAKYARICRVERVMDPYLRARL